MALETLGHEVSTLAETRQRCGSGSPIHAPHNDLTTCSANGGRRSSISLRREELTHGYRDTHLDDRRENEVG
eukprot:6182513-Pleurochrysis_carterae.AAC.1